MNKKPNITGARYVLAVKDLAKSANYYKNELGFSTWWSGEGWHFLKREKFVVMLGECTDDRSAFETRNHSYFAYIEVDNIDALHNEYISKEIEIMGTPGGLRIQRQAPCVLRALDPVAEGTAARRSPGSRPSV